MLGKELDDLSFKELQHLEEQLSEGILSVKDKKVLSFILNLYTFFRVNYIYFKLRSLDSLLI